MSEEAIHTERDQALATMILAFSIAMASFLSVFGSREKSEIAYAKRIVAYHEVLLRQSNDALRQNQNAFREIDAALSKIVRERHR